MGKQFDLSEHVTLLVNSCDAYADLWPPFFALLKKYWNPLGIRILLNTESKHFSFEGLDIECVHLPNETQYGQRMITALSYVKTKYVLLMLDDFFLRSQVNPERIQQIIHWMECDPNIVYFSNDPNLLYADWEVNKYPGFSRIPPGNSYTFTTQAAIWRTDTLKKSWLPSVNPWEWETLTNVNTYWWKKAKFYCLNSPDASFLDYGHYQYGDIWGVYRGKWYLDDVKPLFEREKIEIDFSQRGIFDHSQQISVVSTNDWGTFDHIERVLGKHHIPFFYLFNRYCQILSILNRPVTWDYFQYLQTKSQNRFLRTHRPR